MMQSAWVAASLLLLAASCSGIFEENFFEQTEETDSFTLQIPEFVPSEPDLYLCASKQINLEHVETFDVDAIVTTDSVDSIQLFGCKDDVGGRAIWECSDATSKIESICGEDSHGDVLLYDWSRDPESETYPFKILDSSEDEFIIKSLVVMVHYQASSKETDTSGVNISIISNHVESESYPEETDGDAYPETDDSDFVDYIETYIDDQSRGDERDIIESILNRKPRPDFIEALAKTLDNYLYPVDGSNYNDDDEYSPTDSDEDGEVYFQLVEVNDWPKKSLNLGQVAGVAVDFDNFPFVFHRGDSAWEAGTFDAKAFYQGNKSQPIPTDVILKLDPESGDVLEHFGADLFFIPHGLTVDIDGNIWVTDTALHQVMKFNSEFDLELILGEAFVPGDDASHFCKPTDVAVDTQTGQFFVSDGYCNSRVIRFSPDGEYIEEWDAPGTGANPNLIGPTSFNIVHSLALAEDKRTLFAVDRVNSRILGYDAETGELRVEIIDEDFVENVFAVEYNPMFGGLLYGVNGHPAIEIKGFTLNATTFDLMELWGPDYTEFQRTHDVTVAPDLSAVYVAELDPHKVWKFEYDQVPL